MTQEPYCTNEKLKNLFRNYFGGSRKNSDIARNEISFLERLTGEEVIGVLEDLNIKNLSLYEKERDEKYELLWKIEEVLKSESGEKEKLKKIGDIRDKYEMGI